MVLCHVSAMGKVTEKPVAALLVDQCLNRERRAEFSRNTNVGDSRGPFPQDVARCIADDPIIPLARRRYLAYMASNLTTGKRVGSELSFTRADTL